MEDLLRSQIRESCRLALPNGLQELMCDISREVLRAQPKDINAFITNYLSALLVTRENLTIAATVCREACDGSCCPELEDELREIGLLEDDIERAKITIVEYFNKGVVNEKNLLMTLIKKANIFEGYLPAVRDATRRAFLRHQNNHSVIYESSSESDKDEVALAVSHTLQQYRKTRPSDETYNQMAETVQTSYRAYGVKRARSSKEYSNGGQTRAADGGTLIKYEMVPDEVDSCPSWPKRSINTVSSTSLAGSYMKLPKYVPYSALDTNTLTEFDEVPEKEHAIIDYSNEYVTLSKEEKNENTVIKLKKKAKEGKKRISFNDVKNKTVSAALINNTEGGYVRSSKEVITDSGYLDTDYNGVIPNKDDGERKNVVLLTINRPQYRSENAAIDNGDDAVSKDLDIYNDDLEDVKKVIDTTNEDFENANDDNKIADVHEGVSENVNVQSYNIGTESDNEDTEYDKEHLTTDEDIIEADNESDCSVEEVINIFNANF